MNLQLVVPGLLWPSEQARGYADTLVLPALTTLLGRAQVHRTAPLGPEALLRALFGLADGPAADAPLRRLGETDGLRVTEPVLCADPSHLHFTRDHLLLADGEGLDITAEEAGHLCAALNETFADLGRFEACTPQRWYLYPKDHLEVRFAPLGDVTSRPVAFFLPEGTDAGHWQRAANELQVFLHNHPVNTERSARGARAINNLWFWGLGALPPSLTPPAPHLAMRSPLGRGLARATGLEPIDADGFAALPTGADVLVEVDALLAPSRYLDIERWQASLIALERRWFAPLLSALRARRLHRLEIHIPDERGSRRLVLTPRRLLQFWHKVESLEAFTLLQQL